MLAPTHNAWRRLAAKPVRRHVVPVHVAEATIEDARAIARLHVASWQAGYRGMIPDSVLDRLDPDAWAQQWVASITGSTATVAVARRENVLCGFCSSEAARDPDLSESVGEITAIYVEPGSWSQGIGQALLASELPRLARAGFTSVVLWVLEANSRAQRFYRAAGFRPDGSHRHALGELEIPEMRFSRSIQQHAA